MSFVLALAVLVAFFILDGTLTRMAYTGGIDPSAGAWLANAILFGFGIWIMSSRTEGFAPLRFLGAPFRYLKRHLTKALGLLWQKSAKRFPVLHRISDATEHFYNKYKRKFLYHLLRLYVYISKFIAKKIRKQGAQ